MNPIKKIFDYLRAPVKSTIMMNTRISQATSPRQGLPGSRVHGSKQAFITYIPVFWIPAIHAGMTAT
jgi:hypothetical protein